MARRSRRSLQESAGFSFPEATELMVLEPAAPLAAAPDPELPHHAGHRDRLRARFEKAGPESLADYELIELILFRSIPRRDVKPLAKKLLNHFGGIAELAGASLRRLMEVEGIGRATALDLRIIAAFNSRAMQADIGKRDVIRSTDMLMAYLNSRMANLGREQFRILYLDNKNGLIADEVQHEGTVNSTPVTPREIIRRALELDAVNLLLCHNHPSGDVTPSPADVEMTCQIVSMAQPLGITVHDHIIVGRGNILSMRNQGYFQTGPGDKPARR